jgi:hypothetical protein
MSMRQFFLATSIGVIASLLIASTALAQSPEPTEAQPSLVVDPGMHTAKIYRIAADKTCTLLATGSQDKSIRLWYLPPDKGEPRLLRTLRPPGRSIVTSGS